MLSHRERLIYISTVMKISQIAKQLPLKKQQALADYIRKQVAHDVNYPEWMEIEKDMSELKKNVNRVMLEGVMTSLKAENLPSEAEKIFQNDIIELDEKFRDELKKIDLDKLKESVPKDEMEKLNNLFDIVSKEKSDYEDKR